MKPLAKITVLATLAAIAYGCEKQKLPLGPGAVTALRADVAADEAAEYGPWGAPVTSARSSTRLQRSASGHLQGWPEPVYQLHSTGGSYGGIDIWVSRRASIDDPWGAPENLGPNINSAGNDLAPTFTPDGHEMYFHSTGRGGCGLADLFVARVMTSGMTSTGSQRRTSAAS